MVFGKLFGKGKAKADQTSPQFAAAAQGAEGGGRTIDAGDVPWKGDPAEAACNFALGHLIQNLPQRLTIDGGLHAETYVAAAGAIAGFAAQSTLFDRLRSSPDAKIQIAETADGHKYYFADELNLMLVPPTEAEAASCVWPLAAGAAVEAGLAESDVPDLNAMFAHVAKSLGSEAGGWPSVAAGNRPHMRGRELLKIVWPVATTCFSGRFPGSEHDYGAAPRIWWSAIAARAAARVLADTRDVLPPATALTILMETAIYCSKVEGKSLA